MLQDDPDFVDLFLPTNIEEVYTPSMDLFLLNEGILHATLFHNCEPHDLFSLSNIKENINPPMDILLMNEEATDNDGIKLQLDSKN